MTELELEIVERRRQLYGVAHRVGAGFNVVSTPSNIWLPPERSSLMLSGCIDRDLGIIVADLEIVSIGEILHIQRQFRMTLSCRKGIDYTAIQASSGFE